MLKVQGNGGMEQHWQKVSLPEYMRDLVLVRVGLLVLLYGCMRVFVLW